MHLIRACVLQDVSWVALVDRGASLLQNRLANDAFLGAGIRGELYCHVVDFAMTCHRLSPMLLIMPRDVFDFLAGLRLGYF